MALIVSSDRLSVIFCKDRAAFRHEERRRYDTTDGDGFDNPSYGISFPAQLTLMYSPEGGIQMVRAHSEGKLEASPKPASSEEVTDGGVRQSTKHNILSQPETQTQQKGNFLNPLYEVEHRRQPILHQSNVELFVDQEASEYNAMAASGLPGMSNLDLLNDLMRMDTQDDQIHVTVIPESATQVRVSTRPTSKVRAPSGRDHDQGGTSGSAVLTIDYGDDDEADYILPTSPVLSAIGIHVKNDEEGYSTVDLTVGPGTVGSMEDIRTTTAVEEDQSASCSPPLSSGVFAQEIVPSDVTETQTEPPALAEEGLSYV